MIGETITVLRAGTDTDRYGDTVKDWSDPTRIDIDGCALAPAGADEDRTAGREGVVDGWDLFCPPGADVTALDRVEARGRIYEIDGQPATWTSPYGGTTGGVQVSLRRVEG